ncbi:TadG family pilus assembly protein [Devosia sp. A449]
MNLWARFCADSRANMAVLFAMGFAVSAMVSAVAVDGAALYHERRMIQNGVDLAALSAAGDPGRAASLAQTSLVEAGLLPAGSTSGLTVITGHYNPDPAMPAAARFVAGKSPLNAVSVQFQRPGQLHFAKSWADAPILGAGAIASVTPQVSFSIGSRLASLNDGIANAVLKPLLEVDVSLSALDYQALLSARVDTFGLLDALAGKLNLTAGSYDDLLAMSVDHATLAGALASLLTGAERSAMAKLAGSTSHNGKVRLGQLLDLGPLGRMAIGSGTGQGLFTKISALELLTASAGLSDGQHQVSLGLTAGVPGLTRISIDLAVGEPPQGGGWYGIGSTGTVIRTAQVRMRLLSELGLKLPLLPLLPLLDVRLPLYLEVAHAEAVVASASCPSGSNKSGSATILTRPGIARLILGEVTPQSFGAFNTPPNITEAVLINLIGLKVTGAAEANIAQTQPVALSFSPAEIAAGTVKTAKTSTPVGSLVGSLLGRLTLNAIGIPLGIIAPALNNLLAPLAPTLDLTITRILTLVGLSLGEADVQVYGVRCGHPVLVG